MALNFPDSPIVGDIYTDNTSGFSYEWDGVVWKSYTPSTTNNIKILDDISGSFNGSQTIFPITISAVAFIPANAQQLRIVLGGVIQEPLSDYTVSGTSLIFTTPPTNGLSFSGVSLGPAVSVGVSTIGDVYNRNTYNPTGVQTTFTFAGGYTVGYLDVYQNGVRLSAGSDFTATDGITFDLTVPANSPDEIEAIGYKISTIAITEGQLTNLFVTNNAQVIGITTLNNLSVTSNMNVTGVTTLGNKVKVGVGTTALIVEGDARITGILTIGTSSITLDGSSNSINVGSGITISTTDIKIGGLTISSAGIIGSGSTVTSASVAYGLQGNPTINVSGVNNSGVSTSIDTRILSISEKTTLVNGNIVNLVYNTGGGNIAICTNASGDITLNVTGIPVDSSFNNNSLSFSVITQNAGVARSCIAVNLNGVPETIRWFGGSLAQSIIGVTTTSGYDIYSFIGINTVGSASTTSNYTILGSVNGGYR